MAELTRDQFIYLLYSKAYARVTEAGTVTKSDIKSYLSDEYKGKAEKIYGDLKKQGFIELKTKDGKTIDKKGNAITKDGRFSLTDKGNQVLIENLTVTDYDFTSSKSYKVLGTVLTCLMPYVKAHSQTKPSEEMTFEEFQEKFKALYFEERRQQELRGAVAIYSQRLLQKFAEHHSVSQNKLSQYFDLLKTSRKIFTVIEKEHELMEWAE